MIRCVCNACNHCKPATVDLFDVACYSIISVHTKIKYVYIEIKLLSSNYIITKLINVIDKEQKT